MTRVVQWFLLLFNIAFRLSFGFFSFWVLCRGRGRVRRGLWVGVDTGVVGERLGAVPRSAAKTQSRSKRPLRYRLFKLSYISHYSKPKVMFLGCSMCIFRLYIAARRNSPKIHHDSILLFNYYLVLKSDPR